MKNVNSKIQILNDYNIKYSQAMDFLAELLECVDDIDTILEKLAKHYEADRAYIFKFSSDRSSLDNTHEWCKQGVAPQIDFLQNVPYEAVAFWVSEFERVGAFYISSLDQDLDKNSLSYEILQMQGIESLITAPICKDGKIIGFIGVDNPHSNTNDVIILKTTACIFCSEISRNVAKQKIAIKEMTETQMQQNAELGEIRDIIASANMGTWRIELIDKEEPKMFVDETMKRLLGICGSDISPEQIYDEWFYNIAPDAVASVLSSVDRMQRGYFDENTYLWHHPTKGIRYVRCGGTAKVIPNGYSLQGYHYDVDETVRKSNTQMLKLKKALDEKNEYYETLGALGDIFYSVHVIDLVKDSFHAISEKNEVKNLAIHEKRASIAISQVMSHVVVDDFRESALQFTDLSTISSRMQNKGIISLELKGKNVGWFLATFVTMDKDNSGKPTKIIFVTRVIDEEIKQRTNLIRKSHTDEMTGLLNKRAYESMIHEQNDIPNEDEFTYVSIDANCLKQINDTYGHAAGDELLNGVSQCMKKSLGKYGNLYRLGGDEFVAILFCDYEKAKDVLKGFDQEIDNWKGTLIEKLTLSYGWVNKIEIQNASIRQLAEIAEQRMYEAKDLFYKTQGVDRRGQKDAHKILCELYTKILKINITDDTYQIINMDVSEKTTERGFAESISEWFKSFGKSGFVHPDDLDEYLKLTDLKYMQSYFREDKTSLSIFYRRKYDDGFKQVMMEIVPATDYTEDNMSMYLYVKNIDNVGSRKA